MVTEKPPSLPPDTGPPGEGEPPEVALDPGSVCFTEGTESIDTTLTKKQDRELNPEKYMIIHPVYFEIHNEANAAGFLSDLLFHLQLVDPMAHLLPHGDMPDDTLAFSSDEQIPHDASLSSFTHAYLSGLRVTSDLMLGKFWLRCHKKFTEFKLDPDFLQWLKGKQTSKRVTLDRMELSGTERFPVGFFVNAIAEQRLVENFNYQVTESLEEQATEEVPEFQCDVFTMYNGKNEPTRVYRMMTNKRASVTTLQAMTSALLGKPSLNLTFISYRVWDGLNDEKKTAYRGMQQQFTDSMCALRLSGLYDTTMEISVGLPRCSTPSPDKQSIHKWITSIKSADTTNLFHKVSTCQDGTVEMWLYKCHQKEAREWAKVALGEIARLSAICITTERSKAEAMFKDPDRAWEQLNAIQREDSVPNQRNAFMSFTPPINASAKQQPSGRRKQPGKRPPRKEKLQLHFEMDLVKRTAMEHKRQPTLTVVNFPPLPTPTAASKKQYITGASTASPRSLTRSIDPHAAASAAALKSAQRAMDIGQAAIAKYPPTALEKLQHGGKYYTMTDAHGNNVPIVYIANVPHPLNEKTILESREDAEDSNFEIIQCTEEKLAPVEFATPENRANVLAEEPTPIIKNPKGTPPKIFHRYLGNIPGVTSKDTNRQFWKRPPGSMLEDPNPPGFKDPNQPGWFPEGRGPPVQIANVTTNRKDEVARHSESEEDFMDDDDDDDRTVVSENLSVSSTTKGSRLERAAAAVSHVFIAPGANQVAPIVHAPQHKVTFPSLFQMQAGAQPPMTTWQSRLSKAKGGRGEGRNMNAHQDNSNPFSLVHRALRASAVANRGRGGSGRGGGLATSWHDQVPGDRHGPHGQHPKHRADNNAPLTGVSLDIAGVLNKMNEDHRLDLEKTREENGKVIEMLRCQITDLQTTIAELMHRLEQPQRAATQYDSRIWDVDDEAKAALSFDTPTKPESKLVLVEKRATRGHNMSPNKLPAKVATGALKADARPRLDGKKARISQSPDTKALNPYQVLADEADDAEENVTPAKKETQESHDVVDSDDEYAKESAQTDIPTAGTCDSAFIEMQLPDDSNIRFATAPDDVDSFAESTSEDTVSPKSEAQKSTSAATADSEVDGIPIDSNVVPDSDAHDIKDAQMKEIAADTLQRIAETQNELKRLRVHSPQKSSKSAKPDAGERVDTGDET